MPLVGHLDHSDFTDKYLNDFVHDTTESLPIDSAEDQPVDHAFTFNELFGFPSSQPASSSRLNYQNVVHDRLTQQLLQPSSCFFFEEALSESNLPLAIEGRITFIKFSQYLFADAFLISFCNFKFLSTNALKFSINWHVPSNEFIHLYSDCIASFSNPNCF